MLAFLSCIETSAIRVRLAITTDIHRLSLTSLRGVHLVGEVTPSMPVLSIDPFKVGVVLVQFCFLPRLVHAGLTSIARVPAGEADDEYDEKRKLCISPQQHSGDCLVICGIHCLLRGRVGGEQGFARSDQDESEDCVNLYLDEDVDQSCRERRRPRERVRGPERHCRNDACTDEKGEEKCGSDRGRHHSTDGVRQIESREYRERNHDGHEGVQEQTCPSRPKSGVSGLQDEPPGSVVRCAAEQEASW